MIMRRFVAYLPKLITSILRDYGLYPRKGFMPKTFAYGGQREWDSETYDHKAYHVNLFSGNNFDHQWSLDIALAPEMEHYPDWSTVDPFGFFYMSTGHITKCSPDGQVMWRSLYNSESGDLGLFCVDSEGNLYVNGYESRFKLNANGEVVWEHKQNGTWDGPAVMSPDGDHVYMSYGTSLSKINASDGAVVWTEQLDPASGYSWRRLDVDSSGNVFCFCTFATPGFSAMFNPAGELQWTFVFDRFRDIIVHSDGDIYLSTFSTNTGVHVYVKKYNASDRTLAWTSLSMGTGSNYNYLFSSRDSLYIFNVYETSSPPNQGLHLVNIATGEVTLVKALNSGEWVGSQIRLSLAPSGGYASAKHIDCSVDHGEADYHFYALSYWGKVSKIANNSQFAWQRDSFPGASFEQGMDIEIDISGNVYALGKNYGLKKINAIGEDVWIYGSSEDPYQYLATALFLNGDIAVFGRDTGDNSSVFFRVSASNGAEVDTNVINIGNANIYTARIDSIGDIYILYKDNTANAVKLGKLSSDASLISSVTLDDPSPVDPADKFVVHTYEIPSALYLDEGSNRIYVGGSGYDNVNAVGCPQFRAYSTLNLSEQQRISVLNAPTNVDVYDMVKDQNGNYFVCTEWPYFDDDFSNIYKFDSDGVELARNEHYQWNMSAKNIVLGLDGAIYSVDGDNTGLMFKWDTGTLKQAANWLAGSRQDYPSKLKIGT